MKKNLLTALVAAVFCVSCTKNQVQPINPDPSVQANWSSTDAWQSYSTGGYSFTNDTWGANAGPQTIWVNNVNNWGVWAQHSGSGIKSYPHAAKDIYKNVNSINTFNSTFIVSNPSGGAYSTDYDIWLDNHNYEIMLWTNKSGAVGPIADSYTSNGAVPKFTGQTIGGHKWNVFSGPGTKSGSRVFSFVRTANTSSGTIDIKAILSWIQNKGWFGNPQVQDIQFGWEISNTDGVGKNFSCSSYNVNAY